MTNPDVTPEQEIAESDPTDGAEETDRDQVADQQETDDDTDALAEADVATDIGAELTP